MRAAIHIGLIGLFMLQGLLPLLWSGDANLVELYDSGDGGARLFGVIYYVGIISGLLGFVWSLGRPQHPRTPDGG